MYAGKKKTKISLRSFRAANVFFRFRLGVAKRDQSTLLADDEIRTLFF